LSIGISTDALNDISLTSLLNLETVIRIASYFQIQLSVAFLKLRESLY